MREQPLETAGFAGSKAALPPPAALQIRTQFVFGIGTTGLKLALFLRRGLLNPAALLSAKAALATVRQTMEYT